jgi:hypothetical protein
MRTEQEIRKEIQALHEDMVDMDMIASTGPGHVEICQAKIEILKWVLGEE